MVSLQLQPLFPPFQALYVNYLLCLDDCSLQILPKQGSLFLKRKAHNEFHAVIIGIVPESVGIVSLLGCPKDIFLI